MAWAYFQNQGAFDAYHNRVCADLGIPHPGENVATDEPGIVECWTDAFVNPIQVKDTGNVTTWAAQIPDSHLVHYDDVLGMTAPDSAVVFNGDGTVTIAGKRYTLDPLSFNHRKQKPPTWTDPDTDITYDTSTGEPV